MIQVGIVSDINPAELRARVLFPDSGMVSGWLYVVQHRNGAVSVADDGEHNHTTESAGQHSHPGSTGYMSVGLNITTDGAHTHGISVIPDHHHSGTVTAEWMPQINDRVLVAYLPVENGDGFILGGI